MTDQLQSDENIIRPTGYVYDEAVILETLSTFAATGASPEPTPFSGHCRSMIEKGIGYYNLRDHEVEYLAKQRHKYALTGRKILACGTLEPIAQKTGICAGCSFSMAGWLAWVAHWVKFGTGKPPQDVSLVGPYLMGRLNLRGDNGAYPAPIARGFHDFGVLTVEALAKGLRRDVATMGTDDQEQIAIARRDNPVLETVWLDSMAELLTRVYYPQTEWDAADAIAADAPVTCGTSWQIRETAAGSEGISSLYQLRDQWGRPTGHETVLTGWFTLSRGGKTRLGFIKDESWRWFPASKWSDNRVVIQTDDGPRKLYPGQGACWADEWWQVGKPEAWAIGTPGGLKP